MTEFNLIENLEFIVCLFDFQFLMNTQGKPTPMSFTHVCVIFRYQQRNPMCYGLSQTLLFLIQIPQTKIYIVLPDIETNSSPYHAVLHMRVGCN